MNYKTALLIDDNPVDNYISESLMKRMGFAKDIVTHQSGTEALIFLENIANEEDSIPDIIFLDIRMPVMQGYEFLAEYAKLPDSITQRSKVVILSNNIDLVEDKNYVEHPFVSAILQKPLNQNQLKSLKL
jgi:CheY-like chemotaxis protein